MQQYIDSVARQSLATSRPSFDQIRAAFGDLTMSDALLSRVGQAVHAGSGMFLYGPAGNGKTSIAERISRSFGDSIWIPRAITAAGEIIRLFDPIKHEPVNCVPNAAEGRYDQRWLRIRRPTIIAGGELQMANLDVSYIRKTGVGEAPLQLKSNCGTLLIDDFGRQQMSTDELLNRWIVPLEKRHDFLQLASGRTIQVPFDQLIIFSTNLEPRDLVEDAFLRRIPYKIEVSDASDTQFRELFSLMAANMGIACSDEDVDYLINKHYLPTNRPMRFCQPRDLLRQIQHRCSLHELPPAVTEDGIDAAVENYFSIM